MICLLCCYSFVMIVIYCKIACELYSCIYLFLKSCLPSLVFIYFSKVVYLLLYLFICQKLSTFSCIYLFLKSCLPSQTIFIILLQSLLLCVLVLLCDASTATRNLLYDPSLIPLPFFFQDTPLFRCLWLASLVLPCQSMTKDFCNRSQTLKQNYEYGFNKFKLFVTLINKNNTFFFSQTISKSCLPSLVFIYFSKVVYLLLYLFISQKLSTFSQEEVDNS
jgi:hypothetical protein